MALEWAFLEVSFAGAVSRYLGDNRFAWLLALASFLLVSYLAERWARSLTSRIRQYLGLGGFVVAQAVILLPLLHRVRQSSYPEAVPAAGLLTVVLFLGLTASVWITRPDLSPLRSSLRIALLLCIGAVFASLLLGFHPGVLFGAAVAATASGYVLYNSSEVLERYRTDQAVAAALALFASAALLFYAVLHLGGETRR